MVKLMRAWSEYKENNNYAGGEDPEAWYVQHFVFGPGKAPNPRNAPASAVGYPPATRADSPMRQWHPVSGWVQVRHALSGTSWYVDPSLLASADPVAFRERYEAAIDEEIRADTVGM